MWGLEVDNVEHYSYYDNVFSDDECDEIIKIGKSKELKKATVGLEEQEDKKIRESNVRFIEPLEMKWVYQRLTSVVLSLNNDFFKFDLFGFGEDLQFTEYNSPSGYYKSHIDKAYGSNIRKLSIVLQLSNPEDYKGGELQLLNDGEKYPVNLSKNRATLLAFPSYTLHRVTPLTSGTRYSLVGWVTGNPFK